MDSAIASRPQTYRESLLPLSVYSVNSVNMFDVE